MAIKQITVFVQNKKGTVVSVTDVLSKNNVNLRALSIAETESFGILRLIVNDPELGREKLSADGFSTMLTDVVVIKINHEAGSLQDLLTILADNNVNVEYMYGLSIDGKEASVVLKASDLKKTEEILDRHNVKTLSSKDILSL